MPAERIAMRQVRDVLRLNAAGVSGNEIARRVGVASSTVRLTLKRLAAAGLSWPLPSEMTDRVLEGQLFTAAGKKQGHRRRGEPDWAAVHRELKRKHVTLQILWDEYIERHPDGYRYSRFCELYRGWASRCQSARKRDPESALNRHPYQRLRSGRPRSPWRGPARDAPCLDERRSGARGEALWAPGVDPRGSE